MPKPNLHEIRVFLRYIKIVEFTYPKDLLSSDTIRDGLVELIEACRTGTEKDISVKQEDLLYCIECAAESLADEFGYFEHLGRVEEGLDEPIEGDDDD